jgi:branched-chain amino acid transport system ATP-binding protein
VSTFSAHIGRASYGALTVLQDIDFTVLPASMLVILGSNGAGKSTTLRALVGTVNTTGRRLQLGDADLSALASWRLPGRGMVLVPDGARCFPNTSVFDNLRGVFAALSPPGGAAEFRRRYDETVSFFPLLAERAKAMAGTLSGGQRQMLAVGRALMAQPSVLLLDEPSAGLAPKIVEELFEVFGKIKAERGCAIVMAEQNVGYAAQVADHCLVLEEGRQVLTGTMAEVASDERLRTAYLGL